MWSSCSFQGQGRAMSLKLIEGMPLAVVYLTASPPRNPLLSLSSQSWLVMTLSYPSDLQNQKPQSSWRLLPPLKGPTPTQSVTSPANSFWQTLSGARPFLSPPPQLLSVHLLSRCLRSPLFGSRSLTKILPKRDPNSLHRPVCRGTH